MEFQLNQQVFVSASIEEIGGDGTGLLRFTSGQGVRTDLSNVVALLPAPAVKVVAQPVTASQKPRGVA